MAQSQLALYNMALSLVGSDFTILAVDEESIEAETCGLWYENVRQTILRAAHWNSAKRYSRLTAEATRTLTSDWVSTDPEPGYAYSFELPANMLAARYLTTFQEFSLGYETDQRILSCQIDEPILCYTIDVTDLTLIEPDLYRGIVHGLAAYIAMPLTGKLKRAQDALSIANEVVSEARAANANEMERLFSKMPDGLSLRGYDGWPPVSPYMAAYGPMLSLSGAPVT